MDLRRNGLQMVVVRKRITFTGAAGAGAVGSVTIFTMSSGGAALIGFITAHVQTSLTGASATIALGVTGSTGLFIAATTATGLTTAAANWIDTTPDAAGVALPAAMKDIQIDASIINTIATQNVTGGVIDYTIGYIPIVPGATLV